MSTATLGSLVIELAANTAKLSSDLGRAFVMSENAAKKIKKTFTTALSGIAVGALAHELLASLEAAAKFGDQIARTAEKTGIGTTAIQELSFAAKKAGDIDLESLSTALKKMQVFVSQAASGNKENTKTLAALGLTIEDLIALSPDQQFEKLADSVSALKDPADRARASVDLFGRSGTDLLPVLLQGSRGIRAMRQEAEQLGAVLSAEDIEKLREADDSIKKLDASWLGFWRTLAAKATPALEYFFDTLRKGLGGATEREQQIEDVNSQIIRLQRTLAGGGARGAGILAPGAKEKIFAEIDQLKAKLDLLQNPTPDEGRQPTRGQGLLAPGFADAAKKNAADVTESLSEINVSVKEVTLSQIHNRDVIQQIEDAQRKHNQELAEGRELYDSLRTPAEAYEDTLAHLNQLLADGAINQDTFARATQAAAAQMDSFAKTLKEGLGNALDDMLRTGKFNVRSLVQFIIAELTKKPLLNAINSLVDSLSGLFGGSGGFLASLFGSAAGAGASGGYTYAGAAAGGASFMVGGASGRDRNLVAMSLTRGERVDVTPAGGVGGGNIYITQHNDMRGSTLDAMAAMPEILRRNNESLKADIITGIRRKKYPV